ncbi:helicase with zinc finger domain 2-like [Gigantopelta aegis]|uniref:helicase with zinc finger domain 2-like n=1 Tax=Gigantopelta aegis TaxID=1735272 RepID=UPI001B88B778|nr:helicase with zinc finger domain 2-like [Gigantopelta aegis]
MDVDREILVSDPRLEMSTSQPMTDMMEPIMALTDDAVEKIRCEKFNRTARDEFGKSVTYYLTCCDNLSDELEPHFIIYLQKVIYNLLKERKEFAYPALLLLYKAMSVMKMATYFSPNDGKMIPKINVACQHLSRVLLFMVYTMWTDMASRKQLIKNLQVLAKQNVKENPGFCYILTMDLCEAHHMFSLEPEKSSTLLGELCLLQARSALNGESWDLAMKHCKFAAETIYEYENREAFLIWAEALELKGNVSAAIEKAQLALKLSKNKDERQTVVTYLHKLQDGMVEQISSSDSDKLNESWLEGTNAKMDEEKAKSVRNNHVPKKKRSRPKRKRTDSSCSSSSVSQPMIVDSLTQIGDMSTWTSKRSRQISNSSNSSGFSTTITLPPQTQRPGPHFDDENIDRFLRDHNWDSSSDEDEVRTVSEPVNYADLEGSESDDEMDIDVGCEHLDQTWFEKGMSLDEKDVARFLYCYDVSIKRNAFYRDFFPQEDLQEVLKSKPHGYKRCRIEMESAQKAICKVLGAAGVQNDIEIAGRSRCGQCFNNDEVVVEILFDPKENSSHNRLPSEADSKPFGEVRGVLKSHFHRSSKYPILACTSNETDGWLMRPLCKSIPKIHVVNNKTKKESPHLTKNRIDIYELVGSKLNYKGKFDMNPVLRGQYVFIVVYLGWGKKHVYPLGAVLGVQQCGKDFNSSLKILEMQYKVPSLFPENTLVDQTYIFDASGREDRTDDLVVFTIDPPHSKDLDDALSIYKKDNNYVVGVHIADVASVVKKDDAVDKEARERAVSFYIQNRRTHHMLPDRLSQDICSLVPDKKRPALSIFLMFNPDGKLVKEPIVKKTFIKSCRKLCYEEVQKIIENEGDSTVPSQLKSSILDLHNLAQKIREKRLKDARFSVPFEDVRFCDMEEEGNCDEAHALVEEFMIQTNAAVAKFVKKRFPTCLPLRCQTSPATEEVQNWLKEENRIVDLLVHLQGKEVLPKMVISALEGIRKCVNEKTNFIPIQSDIWKRILDDLKSRDINQAGKMICTDEIHPLQNVAWIHWIKLLDTAEYRCSGVISDTKANHFSLDIQPYIHFTSPIRRYVDLVSHRLVHAILSGDACPYTADDICQICDDVNEATSRQKAFDRNCKVLAKTEKIGKSSMVFHAIVDDVTENGLELLLPGLRTVPSKCREIRFCLLNLNKKPEKKPDPKTNKDLVICQWKKRLYDTKGNKSQVTLNHPPELMIVEPNQHTVLVRYRDWADVLKGIFDKNLPVVQRITKRLDPAGDSELVPSFKGVDAVTSETEQGTIKSHQCRFSLSFKPGQVVKVQLGASPNNGLLLPQVELVHITKNLSLCHRHLDDPVGILSKYATHSVKQDFSSIEHYKKAWLPVLEMEAALSAASNEMTPIINNVNLTLSKTSISDKTVYTGTLIKDMTSRGTLCSKLRATSRPFSGGSVMVWAGIHHGGRTALLRVAVARTGIKYRDDILQHHVIPHMNFNGGMFQHDNARPHVARVSQEFLQRHNIQTSPWLARSPDLNPIEHLWDALDQLSSGLVLFAMQFRAPYFRVIE